MDNQKFFVEIDGVNKEANVVDFFNIDGREFVVYSVDNGNETSDLLYSEIQQDENGYDQLVDVQDENIKQELIEVINSILEV